jgi:regulator of protease activity HflC (stomatin/prohibitin superfamily)
MQPTSVANAAASAGFNPERKPNSVKILLDIVIILIGLAIAARFILPTLGEDHKGPVLPPIITGIVLAVVLIGGGFVVTSGFGTVPAGSVGIVLHWNQPTGELKSADGSGGLYFVCGLCGYSVYTMESSAIRQWPINNANAATKDLQQVDTNITMNFHLDGAPASLTHVYTTLRDNFDNVIGPITLEALKAVTAEYTAQDLIDKRALAKGELDDLLRKRLSVYGIIIDNVSLTDFKFSDQFNQAIEAKVTQEQSALQAEAKLKQTQWEAKSTEAAADADAYAMRVKRQSLTPELVEQYAIDKWDGKLPTVMSGGGSLMGLPSSLLGGK